jgi:hypothetical protein
MAENAMPGLRRPPEPAESKTFRRPSAQLEQMAGNLSSYLSDEQLVALALGALKFAEKSTNEFAQGEMGGISAQPPRQPSLRGRMRELEQRRNSAFRPPPPIQELLQRQRQGFPQGQSMGVGGMQMQRPAPPRQQMARHPPQRQGVYQPLGPQQAAPPRGPYMAFDPDEALLGRQ